MYALFNHENVDVRNDIITRSPSHVPGQKRKRKRTQQINTADRTTNTRLDVEGVLGRGVAVLHGVTGTVLPSGGWLKK